MLAAKRTIFAHLQALGGLALVLVRGVVPVLAFRTLKVDLVSHGDSAGDFLLCQQTATDGAHDSERSDLPLPAFERRSTLGRNSFFADSRGLLSLQLSLDGAHEQNRR